MSLSKRQLLARRKYVGGSEALAALGKDPRCSRLELFMRKRGELPEPDLADNERVHFGNLLEPAMRKEFKRRIGGVPVLRGTHFRYPASNVPLVAHPDGWMPTLNCGAEFKNVDRFEAEDYGEEQTDQVPLRHFIQCMAYMAVTGAARWYLSPLIGGNDFRTYEIARNDDICDAITAGVRDFWSHIESGAPPLPATLDDVKLRWPKDVGTTITATDEIIGACAELGVAQVRFKEAEQRVASLKMEIQQFMQANSELVDEKGEKLATWRKARDSEPVIDLEAFRAAKPDLVADLVYQYQKLRPGARKFLLK